MDSLESMGSEQTRKIYTKHGATGEFYGVKVGDLKKIVKKVKKDHELSIQLYNTGNSDAMYLAGLVADENQISKEQLNAWASGATWYMISEYTVPWIASESPYGWELALEWIESDKEMIAACGWSTLSSIMSIYDDDDLDKEALKQLVDRATKEVHTAQNRVRYCMNNFVIAAGSFVPDLLDQAKSSAKEIGKVHVEMGGTACKVPLATQYIEKVEKMGRIGKKKKQARC